MTSHDGSIETTLDPLFSALQYLCEEIFSLHVLYMYNFALDHLKFSKDTFVPAELDCMTSAA
jgi:hypothetical protein